MLPGHLLTMPTRSWPASSNHYRGHIKLVGVWRPKIWNQLNAAILSKLKRLKLSCPRPFSVCSRTSRSKSWCLRNCFVFVWFFWGEVNCSKGKLLSGYWSVVIFPLNVFLFFFVFELVFFKKKQNKNKRQKWIGLSPMTSKLSLWLCLVCPAIYPIWQPTICLLRVSDI